MARITLHDGKQVEVDGEPEVVAVRLKAGVLVDFPREMHGGQPIWLNPRYVVSVEATRDVRPGELVT